MSWRVVAASEVGTSHVYTSTPCQDSCWAQVDTLPSGQPVLSIFVADGAGSAVQGGEGAELAIQAAADFLSGLTTQTDFALTEDVAYQCVDAIRTRLLRQAEMQQLRPRDFACTFLGLVSTTHATLVMQIGDGGMALDVGNGLEVPVVPMSGMYANMTHFITDEDAVVQMVTKRYGQPVKCAAVFSDGLQRLALNLTDNTVHEPFFTPLFGVMAKVTEDQEEQLQGALVRFLSSDSINERTDDDKTLAMALAIA